MFVVEAGGGEAAGVAGAGWGGGVDDGPVGEFGGLAGVVEVVEFAEGEAGVEDDVAGGVEGVRIDQDRGVGGGVALAVVGEAGGGPVDGELAGEALEDGVAAGVAPEDEVAGGDVFLGDGSVVLDDGFTAELLAPFADGALHLSLDPGGGFRALGLAGGADDDEAIEEGMVNGALEVGDFGEASWLGCFCEFPLIVALA